MMKSVKLSSLFFFVGASLSCPALATPQPVPAGGRLVGTWSLSVADVRHPDGSVERDYGENPAGMLTVDRSGNYVLVVFNRLRPKFASGDRARGTAEEYRSAVVGASTHYGKLSATDREVTFAIEQAGYPNWNGAKLTVPYTLKQGTFAYEGAPRANGDVPLTAWRFVRR